MIFLGNRLYSVTSHKVLAKILDCSADDIRKIAKNPNSYYDVFPIRKNGKERIVQNPKPTLKLLHKRLKRILSDIPLPAYVHSGARGRSYKGNAQTHLGNKYVVTMDIEKFFPSCAEKLVWEFFRYEMMMSPDVARTVAKICCCNGHIPTGSPISLLLAYLINASLFDSINKNAIKIGQTFSLYVDDMTFSTNSKKIARTYHLYINKVISQNGLKLKKSKVVYFAADEDKVITGCKIDKAEPRLMATDKLKKKLFAPLRKKRISDLTTKEARSSLGRVHSARFVEGDIFNDIKDKMKEKIQVLSAVATNFSRLTRLSR